MRIKATSSWRRDYEAELEEYVADQLQRGGDGGALEDIKDNINRLARALGYTLNHLVEKRVLTLKEVNELLGEPYDVEEVK